MIDFEEAKAVRPSGTSSACPTPGTDGRTDLHEALLTGYGRPLSPAEEEHLIVLSLLDAVSGIQYGAAHGDPELVERGRRTLARLRATNRL
ncbi:hypothetical protein ACNFR7_00805 [Streptomyces sp. RM1]